MLALFPEGFEEREYTRSLDLVAYGGAEAEEHLSGAFGRVVGEPVESDWAERWKRFHRSVRIGSLWVGPSWEEPDGDANAVVIDPGQAFGTGAHPTTRLCLELLLGLEPASLVDLGCGSGVLAVAAAKLGFRPVVAVDSDVAAVEATRANASVNGVAVEAHVADVRVDSLPKAAVVVANIALPVVLEAAACVEARLLVASGYLASERAEPFGWRPLDRREADGWAADLLERFYH